MTPDAWVWRRSCSYFSRAAKGRDGEKRENGGNDDGQGDEPMSDIAGPGAESIVQPGESQDAKEVAPEVAPEAVVTATGITGVYRKAPWWSRRPSVCE